MIVTIMRLFNYTVKVSLKMSTNCNSQFNVVSSGHLAIQQPQRSSERYNAHFMQDKNIVLREVCIGT